MHRLGEVTRHRLVDLRGLHELDEADLGGIVAVLCLRLELRDDAGPDLDHGYRVNHTGIVEDLGHTDLLAQHTCY